MLDLQYSSPGATAARFFSSSAFVRGLRGPVGSGKSVCGCIEIMRRAVEQSPSPIDGKRKTRWAIIRNTGPELKTTTIKTWLDWYPEDKWGRFKWSPPLTHHIKRQDIDCEVIFIALDKPEDVKKLLSLELTGAFINEAREIPKAIVDGCTMRVGRYPSQRDGGPSWSGVIMDTNSPDEDHWWAIMSGDCVPPDWMNPEDVKSLVKPADWEFFSQPGAVLPVKNREGAVIEYRSNPDRENKAGVPDSYYQRMLPGKTQSWINVYVANLYGSLMDGKAVYPDWNETLHLSDIEFGPLPGHQIYVGMDFGLDPVAVFGQKVRGRWLIFDELVSSNMGITKFIPSLKQKMLQYGGEFSVWGDPTGDQRVQTDEKTPFRVLKANGVMIRPTATNDPILRIGGVEGSLTRLTEGKSAFLLSPKCRILRAGFNGGYHYKRLNISGAERFETSPDKNKFSHPHDALQYMLLGGGEGRKMLGTDQQTAVKARPSSFDVFNRGGVKVERPRIKNW